MALSSRVPGITDGGRLHTAWRNVFPAGSQCRTTLLESLLDHARPRRRHSGRPQRVRGAVLWNPHRMQDSFLRDNNADAIALYTCK